MRKTKALISMQGRPTPLIFTDLKSRFLHNGLLTYSVNDN